MVTKKVSTKKEMDLFARGEEILPYEKYNDRTPYEICKAERESQNIIICLSAILVLFLLIFAFVIGVSTAIECPENHICSRPIGETRTSEEVVMTLTQEEYDVVSDGIFFERTCWYIENPEDYSWCEPDYALYNSVGYKVLTAEWLSAQLNGSPAQSVNALEWVKKIGDKRI